MLNENTLSSYFSFKTKKDAINFKFKNVAIEEDQLPKKKNTHIE